MIYQHLRIAGLPTPVHPLTLAHEPGPLTPLAELESQLASAKADGERLVVFTGYTRAHGDHLLECVARAVVHSLKVAVAAQASLIDAPALSRTGVDVLVLPLLGDAAHHDAILGEGAFDALLAVASHPAGPRVRLHVPVTPQGWNGVALSLRALAPHVEHVTLHADDLDPAVPVAELLEQVWRALRHTEVQVALQGVFACPDTHPATPRPLDDLLWSLRTQGGWLPGLGAGVTHGRNHAALHALGMPAIDAPITAPLPCPPGPTAIVVPHLGDQLLATVTLPALAEALEAAGRPTTLHSVWERPWNLEAPAAWLSQADLHAHMPEASTGKRRALAQRFHDRFLDRLDLSDARHVIVPGWATAQRVRTHPTLHPDAVIEVVDLHLLDGFHLWEAGGAWPAERLRVVSCFAGFADAYIRRGVSLDGVRFRPYPVALTPLPAATPGSIWLAAGNHRRDHGLLERAVRLRPPEQEIDVITAQELPNCPGLNARAPMQLADLFDAIAACKGVVLPVAPHPHDAAGISLAAFAVALGKPVLGTTAWGLFDHIAHDEAGWLVPPHDADALAQALHTSPEHLARWSRGAAEAGRAADVSTLAATLLGHEVPTWPVRRMC